jgi:AcrR family transcriptional regulator
MAASFRERQRQVREREILEAAFELLTARGYAAMTMDDVAAAVGISKATLYRHFRSKEALTVSVAVSVLQRIEAQLQSLDTSLPAAERIRQLMEWVIQFRCAAEQRRQAPSTGGVLTWLRPVVWEDPWFQAQKDRLVAAFCTLIEAAQAEGSVTTRIPSRVLVQAMLSLMRDFDYAELLADLPVSPEELSRHVVEIFLNGTRNQG